MDTQIDRLLAPIEPGVLENTFIIFMGDNGRDNFSPAE